MRITSVFYYLKSYPIDMSILSTKIWWRRRLKKKFIENTVEEKKTWEIHATTPRPNNQIFSKVTSWHLRGQWNVETDPLSLLFKKNSEGNVKPNGE